MTGWPEFDTQLFILVNQVWINPFFDWLMPLITDFDNTRIPLIVLLLVILAKSRIETRLGILFAILAVVAADQVSSSWLKDLFERVRPFHVVEGTRKLIGAHGWSFPSSHAANCFAAGTFLAVRFRKFRPILLLAFAIAYSRVYVGVHYPLDVTAGALLGAAIGGVAFGADAFARVRLERWRTARAALAAADQTLARGGEGSVGSASDAPERDEPLDR